METFETPLQLNENELRKAKLILRAINHPLRQKMLHLIHEKGRMIVTELYNKLRIEQSVASQHLAILRKAGFVNTQRDAKFIFYSVNYVRLNEVQELSKRLIEV